ncbi:MAG: flagellar basal body P-ring protein FlgI [Mariniblastus sp.]|nr:flagellar basal body P-ring protein FlgI [Mariniblastus sp.]
MKTQGETRDPNSQIIKVGRRVFLAGLVVTATGCKNMIRRGQSPDDTIPLVQLYDENVSKTKYIGDICGIWGLDFAKVDGIGLATNLKGTGSPPRPGGQRDQLIRDLEMNENIEDAKKLVKSDNTELVVMYGMLPPGIRKGETFDLKVSVLANSDATSLESGNVLQTRMRPMRYLGRKVGVKQGHVTALAKGPIVVDAIYETRQDQKKMIEGTILGGGKALEDRPLGLAIRTDEYSMKTTTMMSRAINSRFTAISSSGRKGVAEPKTDKSIELIVPDSYRLNIGRYLAVIKNIAFSEQIADRVNRMELLDREMGEPAKAGETALRLEALGKDGIPALKRALRHNDLEVQFHAAQALAYSGEADGVDILIKCAREEPAFRWHAMTALASLDDVSTSSALADLMQVPSAETRYGAFRAMRAQSPNDPLIAGDWLAKDFFLHEIPSDVEPMVHFSKSKRQEIVLFGHEQKVSDDFMHIEKGITIRGNGNGRVSITRYSAEYGDEKTTCTTKVADLVRTLAKFGFTYSSMLKMFRNAQQSEMIDTRLVVNAIPKLGRKYSPDEMVGGLPPEKSKRYVAEPMPELFRTGEEKRVKRRVQEETVGSYTRENEEEKPSQWSKLKGWATGDSE